MKKKSVIPWHDLQLYRNILTTNGLFLLNLSSRNQCQTTNQIDKISSFIDINSYSL